MAWYCSKFLLFHFHLSDVYIHENYFLNNQFDEFASLMKQNFQGGLSVLSNEKPIQTINQVENQNQKILHVYVIQTILTQCVYTINRLHSLPTSVVRMVTCSFFGKKYYFYFSNSPKKNKD